MAARSKGLEVSSGRRDGFQGSSGVVRTSDDGDDEDDGGDDGRRTNGSDCAVFLFPFPFPGSEWVPLRVGSTYLTDS